MVKTWLCTGYPDEENIHFNNHTQVEEWICEAENEKEALRKAREHLYFFHEISVEEQKTKKEVIQNVK